MNRAFRDVFQSETLNVQEALGYLQVDLWPDVLSLYGDFNAAGGGVTARETVAIVHLPFNTFFKGGRFFPPFGLRVYEDASFIRSNTGFTFQNPFEGGEAGIVQGPFYLATSVTNASSGGGSSGSGTSSSKNVLTSVNGYGMFEDVPVVRNVLAGGSFAHQSTQRNVSAFYAGSNIWQFTYLGEFDLIDDTTALPANTGRDQFASYAEVDWLLFNWLNLRGTFDFLKVVREPQPDALPDRSRALHRQVHPAASLLRDQQRPREPTAAEHDRAHLRAALLLLDGAPYFTDSTTIPFRPPCATFRPSTVIVFAAESMAAA